MASPPIPMEPTYLIDLIIKRRWFILVPFLIAVIVGIGLAIKLPRIYEASTLILIQPQRVPEEYVQSIVTSDAGERINTLSQQILSRTNMEKIIAEFDLFSGSASNDLYMEDKIKALRESISVSVSDDKKRQNEAFSISYQGKDPGVVMRVTNTLASYFIDENLRLREAQAVGTSDFLDAELLTMKQRLETVEAQLKAYREKYMGALPEQLESNLQILDRLEEHLAVSQQRLGDAKIRLAALQSESELLLSEQSTRVVMGPNDTEETNDVDQLKVQLDILRNRYTPKHPDIISLAARIAELEAQAADELPVAPEDAQEAVSEPQTPSRLSAEFRTQQSEIQQEIWRLETDIANTRKQIAVYTSRVEDTPKREQELMSLRRDYQNIQMTYDSLLGRKLEAEIAVNMERKQKGEQFRILDSARMPQRPVKPDMRKLFIMVVGAGLAVGGGIIFLLEYINNSFKRPEDIEADLKVPVLCSVPQIISRKTRLLKRFEYALFSIFGLLAVAVLAGFAALTLIGMAPTLELVGKFVNIQGLLI